jgi:hypothetical protein
MRPSEEARKYIGEKEILGNKGFVNPAMEAEMKEEGWQKGYAWCMVLARVVFVNAFPAMSVKLRKLFVPGVLNTFRNLKKAAYPIAELPQVDALVIWAQVKEGVQTGFGHAGIVSELVENGFKSIEGNTGDENTREGYIVRENTHKIAEKGRVNGLKLIGFVIIKPITIA